MRSRPLLFELHLIEVALDEGIAVDRHCRYRAGIHEPMMTFSLRPWSSSTRPPSDASVRTRVVSWNEAAETQLSVESEPS